MRCLALALILLLAGVAARGQVLAPGAMDPLKPTLYDEALRVERAGDVAGAVKLYMRAARSGEGKAAYRLGEIFEKGLGTVAADAGESRKWFNAARTLGYPPAVGDFPSPPR